jgi:hypothetical protein
VGGGTCSHVGLADRTALPHYRMTRSSSVRVAGMGGDPGAYEEILAEALSSKGMPIRTPISMVGSSHAPRRQE